MRMKIWGIIALLCCAILVIGIPAATSAEGDMDFLYFESEEDISVVGYTGTETEIVIPAEINGKPVTGIKGPFDIPHEPNFMINGVTDIDRYTLNRPDLISITIPATVVSIGREAFVHRDSSLQEINVDAGNPVYASVDGVLFDQNTQTLLHYPACKPDAEYMIPQGVQHIETCAFDGCVKLRSVTIPDSMTVIDGFSFSSCKSLEQVSIPSSVTHIEFGAFMSTGLTSVEIPNGVTAIKGWAFRNCPNLTRIIIADSVTELDGSVFSFCPNLTDVQLSAGLTDLSFVFEGCSSLTKIIIPESVKTLSGSFRNCTALTDVTLPDDLREIGEATFMGCTSLETLQLPSSLRFIGSSAFTGCTALKQMDFSACPALLAIDKDAFNACTSLQEITLSDGMPSLGDRAFERCESLETVNWIHVPVPEALVGEGEINYLPAADRLAMIRMMARHAARQKGYTVIADTDRDGNPVDKEAWLGDRVFALEQVIAESKETISAAQAEIENPETAENKKKVLNNRIASAMRAMEEDEESLARLKEIQLLTDSEAQVLWWMDTGIINSSEYDLAVYEQWQNTFVAMQSGEGLPEGFANLIAYLSAEGGLGISNADLHALEHITNTFTVNGDGAIYYMPGAGTAGIGSSAFNFCQALKSVTIPASVEEIAPNAFAGCSADLTVTAEPGSYAEQFCLQNNIPCITP